MRSSRSLFVVLTLSTLLTGCSTHFPLNSPLATADLEAREGYRFPGHPEPDRSRDLFVALAFSGGGTRAAALAWGVLETLRETEIVRNGQRYRLIDEIDLISAVSGGTIVGAYFALHGERAFEDFPERFLFNDIQGKALKATLSPRQWPRLASRYFDLVDLMAEVLDREVFDGHTFADLETRRPFLVINATDTTQGVPFAFTQDRFDRLCSDLSTFPVARAIAASSAVPVVFRPLTLASYGWDCGYPEPHWIEAALAAEDSLELRRRAEVVRRDRERSWVHLIDGAVADNVGLRFLDDLLLSPVDDPCDLVVGQPSDIIVIAVDAGTGLEEEADFVEDGPSLAQIVWATANTSVDRLSERALDQLDEKLVRWTCSRASCSAPPQTCRADAPKDEPLPGTRLYPIVVSLQNAPPDERELLLQIPTTLTLDPPTVDRLRETGRSLLQASPAFQRLIHDDVP